MSLSTTPIWEQVGSQMSNVFYASSTEPFSELVERVPQLEQRTKQRQSPNKTELLASCMSGDVCVLKCPPDHKPFDISSQFGCCRHFFFHGSQNQVDSCMLFRGHSMSDLRLQFPLSHVIKVNFISIQHRKSQGRSVTREQVETALYKITSPASLCDLFIY